MTLRQKRECIDQALAKRISLSRQCDLLDLARSSHYYDPVLKKREKEEEYDNILMKLLDRQFTRTPFYGSRRLAWCLQALGHRVGRRRTRRLMQRMGIEVISPKPRKGLSNNSNKEHPKYPYLLRTMAVHRPNQVWCSDITYIPMNRGFAYLTAVMDWHSRHVVSWRLSQTMEAEFCVQALEQALEGGKKPDIFNTDQGAQFTSQAFTGLLESQDIQISMDGRGRFADNIFVERLWRTVKYEEVYIKDYESITEARKNLDEYFDLYNRGRPHSALGNATPEAVYLGLAQASPVPPRKLKTVAA